MRYYRIEITDSAGNPVVDSDGNLIGPYDSSNNAAGAMNISFDALITAADVASAGTMLTIYGIPLSVLSQSVNLWQCRLTLFAGFSGGLPLENESQSGVILQGSIINPYGNWEGTFQSLNLIIAPSDILNDVGQPLSITVDGKKGEKLSDVLLRALTKTYSGHAIDISISDNLVLVEDFIGVCNRLSQLAVATRSTSKKLLNQSGYLGVQMVQQQGRILVFDNLSSNGVVEIKPQELIGQPTWIELNVISFKTPMRADLIVSDVVTLPIDIFDNGSSVLSVGSEQAFMSQKQKLNFSGKFLIKSVRHVGEYRNSSGGAWVTITEAYALTVGE